MNRDPHNELQCSQFEALLADALDDTYAAETGLEAGIQAMPGESKRAFLAHRQSCSVCGPLFAEAQRGMLLLHSLEEIEPPKNLVHNILAATSGAEETAPRTADSRQAGWLERLRYSLRPTLGGLLHSRFATSFCMAFFSLSLTLTLAGVRVDDLLKAAAHPSTLRRSVVLEYTQVEAKFMRYYDNMRLVYEVESRVQQLKKAVAPQNSNTNDNKPEQQNDNRPVPSTRPEQEENSSEQRDSNVIAKSTMQVQGAQL
jgi:hypothetical protein